MDELALAMFRNRDRLAEVAAVLARYGWAGLLGRRGIFDEGTPVATALSRVADRDLALLSPGERLRGALVELGTTWVKFGQMLSLRPDVVGADVAHELELLQAQVPADPPGRAHACVEAELGPTDDLFGSFEVEAFASGSVAQVHHARLKDGTAVVVKVLHDGAAERVEGDLQLMVALAGYLEAKDPEIAQYRPSILVGEFRQMMRSAIDLRDERDNLQAFAANFAAETDVVVPKVYPDLCSRRVVTMGLVTGATFSDRAAIEETGWDPDTLVRRAAEIYLDMIFRDGVYHADPHPGNFLLPDASHLAILDFGDVGRLSAQRRHQLESLVIAVVARDTEQLTDVCLELTSPPPDTDVRALGADLGAWMDRYLLAGVAHLDMAGIIASGMELMRKHHLVLPADLALLFRVLLRLQGLGRNVGTDIRVTELLAPRVGAMASARFDPKRLAHHMARTAREWEHFFSDLPGDLASVLEQLKTGRLGVDLRVHDADGAADRLVDGLLASASVLAAGQLVSRRVGPMLGGISVPGLLAAGVGVLTWRRLTTHRAGHESLVTRARRSTGG
ncbi:AarF/ABC1/UbiB kinase family protein [Kineosporia sp. A_224]|uniref:ABC1 kinase family protein n=1 Tax=Kineosporia sp. A_224 TaxID=1962180 RepID=UPI000B4BBDEB|nr:AarF/UbiB family protein [Kineosporia sp. A_224]